MLNIKYFYYFFVVFGWRFFKFNETINGKIENPCQIIGVNMCMHC